MNSSSISDLILIAEVVQKREADQKVAKEQRRLAKTEKKRQARYKRQAQDREVQDARKLPRRDAVSATPVAEVQSKANQNARKQPKKSNQLTTAGQTTPVTSTAKAATTELLAAAEAEVKAKAAKAAKAAEAAKAAKAAEAEVKAKAAKAEAEANKRAEAAKLIPEVQVVVNELTKTEEDHKWNEHVKRTRANWAEGAARDKAIAAAREATSAEAQRQKQDTAARQEREEIRIATSSANNFIQESKASEEQCKQIFDNLLLETTNTVELLNIPEEFNKKLNESKNTINANFTEIKLAITEMSTVIAQAITVWTVQKAVQTAQEKINKCKELLKACQHELIMLQLSAKEQHKNEWETKLSVLDTLVKNFVTLVKNRNQQDEILYSNTLQETFNNWKLDSRNQQVFIDYLARASNTTLSTHRGPREILATIANIVLGLTVVGCIGFAVHKYKYDTWFISTQTASKDKLDEVQKEAKRLTAN